MDIQTYLDTHFGELLGSAAEWRFMSDGYRKRGIRIGKIFDEFFHSRFGNQEICLRHFVAFIHYRVLGEKNSSDRFSGASALYTVIKSELAPLVCFLRSEGRTHLTCSDVRGYPEFRKQVAVIRKSTDAHACHSHARIIWLQDELRLISCLTLDTASKRDHAMIVLMLRTGFRARSVSEIRTLEHVSVTGDVVEVMVPDVKTNLRIEFRTILVDEDAKVFIRWWVHRQTIHPDCPFLFITRDGTRISCDTISRMLSGLSQTAGYGSGFYSSHSFRTSYVNRICAKVYSNGGSNSEALDRVTDGRRWSLRSAAITAYIDPNVRRFFEEGYKLSHEAFENLTPELVHNLSDMTDPQRRPMTWFNHSENKLQQLCHHLNVQFTPDQTECRYRIGKSLEIDDIHFRSLVEEVLSSGGQQSRKVVLSNAIGCILEDARVEVCWWMYNPWRQELIDALAICQKSGKFVQSARHAQKTQVHRLFNADQAQWLHSALAKRKFDRRLHLGKLPSGDLVLLRGRSNERNCAEAQLPQLDVSLHFPETQ